MTNCAHAGGCAGSNYPFLTSYERDNETDLDYAQARYYASKQGRFTSVDPLMASATAGNPQTFNRYTYALNSPQTLTDPTGMLPVDQAPGSWGPGKESTLKEGLGGAFSGGNYSRYLYTVTVEATIGDPIIEPPQNSEPELVPCTFNINISGASGQISTDAQNELGRVFGSGGMGLNVVFNQPGQANGGSTNLSIVSAFGGEAAAAIVRQGGGSPSNVGILGVTPTVGNSSYVNQSHIGSVTTGYWDPVQAWEL